MSIYQVEEDDEGELRFRLDYTHPIDVKDFGESFHALGKQFENFVSSAGYETIPDNAHLFVSDVQRGSIIVTLKTVLEQATFLVEHIEVLGGFVANLNEIIHFILHHDKTPKPDGVTTEDIKRVATIVEPVAKDSGASLSINVERNSAPVHINFNVTSERAKAIRDGARTLLGPPKPTSGAFESEVLYLEQIRGNPKSTAGDRGIIEKYSDKPVRLHFATPDVKAAILENEDNPFKMAYVVDGEVSTVQGKPALYKVAAVHETLERP